MTGIQIRAGAQASIKSMLVIETRTHDKPIYKCLMRVCASVGSAHKNVSVKGVKEVIIKCSVVNMK